MPRSCVHVKLVARTSASAREQMLSSLLARVLRDQLTETTYMAEMACSGVGISASSYGRSRPRRGYVTPLDKRHYIPCTTPLYTLYNALI